MEVAITTNQLVTFQLEDDIFGIDIMLTQEILKLNQLRKIPNSPVYFEGMLNLRGEVIPVINFKKLFSIGTFDLSRDKGIIIIHIENQHFGIVIDKILRVISFEQTNIKPVPEGFSIVLKQYIAGVIEEQDELIALLDIASIFQNTSKDLLTGEMASNALDFRRDKLELLSIVEEKVILNFLNGIDFKLNIATEYGVFNYFSHMKIKTNLSMGDLVKREQEYLGKEDLYSPFKKEKEGLFFDYDEDFLTFFSLLEYLLVPKKEREKDLTIKIVNLGCGKGEELYSILFVLQAFIPNIDKWNLRLIGVEGNYNNITIAQQGIYTEEQLIKLNKKDLPKFFHKLDDGRYQVKDSIKEKVDFRFGTPKNFEKMKDVDIFFCRGIFSKLDVEGTEQLLFSISNSLKPFGILMLSGIEDLFKMDIYTFLAKEINGRQYYVKNIAS